VNGQRASLSLVALLMLVGLVGTAVGQASPTASETTSPRTLAQARTIRAELNAQLRLTPSLRLRMPEATSTEPVSWFTLLSEDVFERRFVPAQGGVWYSICVAKGPCVSPAPRLTRPAADLTPRRLALELAVRTFLETDAPVVGVSLPTPRFVAVILERDELERTTDMESLARTLQEEPLRAPSASLQLTVDELTRPRTYLFVGLEWGPNGGMSWAGLPRWPDIRW
jgi:hypothetical protein